MAGNFSRCVFLAMSTTPTTSETAKPGQWTAMISSTAVDLPEHRAAVKEACLSCGVFPIGMEHLPARDATGITVSLEMVEQADIYLGIYAWRYGWVPDGKDISITEMEFDHAVERQKAGKIRELLIFPAHDDHPTTAKCVEADATAQKKLAAFKTKASNGRVRAQFKSVEELRRLVSDALHAFLLRQPVKNVGKGAVDVIPSNLPGGYIGRLFLGRDAFLDQLRDSLQKQTHATAITQATAATGISGLGGIGKTHAAVEYAHRHRGDYAALLFVSGDSPQKLSASLAALCGVLHLDAGGALPPDEASRVAAAVDWLASHRDWLLIVDNVDTVESAAALTGLLERLTTGHVLITSRLHGWADNVESLDLDVLSSDAATELLLQLTDKQRRKAADDAEQARVLADLLEGLPLALHQAAGYIREQRLTLAGYLVIYKEEAAELLGWFNQLTIPYAGPEEVGPRPVLITWKTSFDKLDADTRFWLLVFAHYAADPIPEFLLDSAPEAPDEVKTRHRAALKAIAQAETYSLLTRYDDPPRFKLHRLVQHIIRLSAPEAERASAWTMGVRVMAESRPGDPSDVRTWARWNPLQSHADVLAASPTAVIQSEHLNWLLNCLALLLFTKSLNSRAEQRFRDALKLNEFRHGSNHQEVATSLGNLATFLQATNRLSEAEPLMWRALRIDEANFGAGHHKVAIDLNNLAVLLQDTNRLAEAEPLMRRVVKIFEISFGKDHPNVATSLNNLAQLLKTTNRLTEAELLMRGALKIDDAFYGPDHPAVARDISNLAMLFCSSNRWKEAEPLLRRSLGINEESFGSEVPQVATSLNNLAQLLQATNRLAEAEPLVRRALGISEASYGPDHPRVAIDLNNLASLLQATNRAAEAEPLVRRALVIDEASFGPEHPNVAIDLDHLAQALQSSQKWGEAELLVRRALLISESAYGPHHTDVAIRLNNLAQLLQATNRLAEAEPLMRRALAIDEASFGPDHPDVARDLNNLAQLFQVTNRMAQAEPLIRRALAINEVSYGKERLEVAFYLNNLAMLLQATNRKVESESLMRRALGILVRSLGLEHPNSQGVRRNYVGLLKALEVPEAEMEERVRGAVAGV